ncbi:hypothetical protein P9E34_04090 [Schinkia azotoformans]|uniref:hypothetical protein n=1 Tax=Schinkia azotoformans TaxID=1454 RepID=UPI002DBCC030|nr:hypothetical protein [Schinkia azotoformans]MEC1723926.1 hypothetical protein [Schinkia azotoformans]
MDIRKYLEQFIDTKELTDEQLKKLMKECEQIKDGTLGQYYPPVKRFQRNFVPGHREGGLDCPKILKKISR